MLKKLFQTFFIVGALSLVNTSVYAAAANNSTTFNLCTGGAALAFAGGANPYCRMTPAKYEVTVYEMGLCTAHPFNNGEVSTVAMDKSTCTVIFTNATGSMVDIVQTLGGKSALTGTASRPADGTYKYPYMVMSNQFTINGSVLGVPSTAQASTIYYSDDDGTPKTTAPAEDYSYALQNMGGGSCYSGSIDQTGNAGTIDAYLTNDAYARRETTDYSNPNCTGVTRLIGIMDLDTPFTVTPNTQQVLFTFNVTNQGLRVQADTSGNTGAVTVIESGPFGGDFSVVNAD